MQKILPFCMLFTKGNSSHSDIHIKWDDGYLLTPKGAKAVNLVEKHSFNWIAIKFRSSNRAGWLYLESIDPLKPPTPPL